MIKAKNTIMKERIRINRVASEIVFQPSIQTMALRCYDECVVTVREEPSLHLEFHQRDVTNVKRSGDGARKNTHIEIRDVVGTFFVSFNGEVQCTTDYIDHVLPALTGMCMSAIRGTLHSSETFGVSAHGVICVELLVVPFCQSGQDLVTDLICLYVLSQS